VMTGNWASFAAPSGAPGLTVTATLLSGNEALTLGGGIYQNGGS